MTYGWYDGGRNNRPDYDTCTRQPKPYSGTINGKSADGKSRLKLNVRLPTRPAAQPSRSSTVIIT